MASQEFLASFAVDIDESGVSRLQEILSQNRELAESLAAAFDSASAAIRSFAEELGVLPGFSSGGMVQEGFSGLSGLTLGLDTSAAEKDLNAFIAMAKKPVPLSANASGMVSAARAAYNSIKSIFSNPITIKANVQKSGDTDDGGGGLGNVNMKMSSGGRFTKPTDVQVAEDGDAEYIIPVKKEDKALPLLKQLLSELSPAARESLTGNSELRIQNSELMDMAGGGEKQGTILSGGMLAGNASAAQITQNNNTVSAPVNIHVTSTGANAERIGQSLYDTAERYLLRTLEGAIA